MAKALKVMLVCFLLGHVSDSLAQETLVITDDELVINDIQIQGNDVTRKHVILRELMFSIGDTILKMELLPSIQRSKDNLLNLALFNFVHFGIKHLGENRIDVNITVTERWYIWPVPILEYADRNFSTFIKNKDWDKINYGAWLKWNNFRGRNDLLTAKIRLGYIQEYSLAYSAPNLGKNQRHGVSTGFIITHQNEVYIATRHNMPVEYRPRDTPAQIRFNTGAKYTYRRKHYTTHSMEFQYFDYQVSDSVAIVNSNYLGGGDTRMNFFSLAYKFNYDIRDSKIYPLEGFNVKIRAEQLGLGLIPDYAFPAFRVTGVMMYHQKLANRLYFYNASKFQYSSEKYMPHILNQGLGYHEFMSGYEPYVIDGSDYVISKYNVKIQVIKPSTYTLPLIGMEQFNKIHYAIYFNVFADAGYVNNKFPDPTNTMVNNWQFSAGAGIDLVTYYDQVFRIDYAINRYGEHGFFFHVETPFSRW
jgi:outer membrane protein assembly factor BamA